MAKVRIEGEVDSPREIGFEELAALPDQIEDVATLVPGRKGGAVRLSTLLRSVGARETARWATLGSADGRFAICVPRELISERGLVVYRLGDGPLPSGSGGPVRVLIAGAPAECSGEIDTCAAVKDLGFVRLSADRQPDVGHEHH